MFVFVRVFVLEYLVVYLQVSVKEFVLVFELKSLILLGCVSEYGFEFVL